MFHVYRCDTCTVVAAYFRAHLHLNRGWFVTILKRCWSSFSVNAVNILSHSLWSRMPPKPRARTYAATFSDSATDSCGSATAADDDYRQKRDRNNIAVKKSREKSRQRSRETTERMERLREENAELEQRTVELAAELRTLKDLLLARAGGSSARRNAIKTEKQTSSSASSSQSQDAVVLADPDTVNIDHEYTSTS